MNLADLIEAQLRHMDENNLVDLWNIFQDATGNEQIYVTNSDELIEQFANWRHFLKVCQGSNILTDTYFSYDGSTLRTFCNPLSTTSPFNTKRLADWLVSGQQCLSLDAWFAIPKYEDATLVTVVLLELDDDTEIYNDTFVLPSAKDNLVLGNKIKNLIDCHVHQALSLDNIDLSDYSDPNGLENDLANVRKIYSTGDYTGRETTIAGARLMLSVTFADTKLVVS